MREGLWIERRRIGLVAVVAICLFMFSVVPAQAVKVITMIGTDAAPEQAHGAVRFRWLFDPDDDIHRVKMRFNAEGLLRRHGRVYSLWFVDGQTGQTLLLGTFDTDRDGSAEFSQVLQINTLDYYERLIVTSEPQNDMDPRPDELIVLRGISPNQPRGSN